MSNDLEKELQALKNSLELQNELSKTKQINALLLQCLKEKRDNNTDALAHLKAVKKADAKRGKTTILFFDVQICEYKCLIGIDAIIAALEIETKNNQ